MKNAGRYSGHAKAQLGIIMDALEAPICYHYDMKRTALVIRKDLTPGQVGNVCAILMAEVVRTVPEAFASVNLLDRGRLRHAAPRFSIAVLKANGAEQLMNSAHGILSNDPELIVVAFSEVGQGLNNEFDVYAERIVKSTTDETALVGLAISGNDVAVRRATKKFSAM